MRTFQDDVRDAVNLVNAGGDVSEFLRTLLIGSTGSDSTRALAMGYFRQHLQDRSLLRQLIEIALEGEDNGDAPWAAANVITEFPAHLLREIQPELIRLSQESWMYLHDPAKLALGKIRTEPLP